MWDILTILYGVAFLLLLWLAATRLFRCRHPEVLVRLRRDEQGHMLKPVILDYQCMNCMAFIGSTEPKAEPPLEEMKYEIH